MDMTCGVMSLVVRKCPGQDLVRDLDIPRLVAKEESQPIVPTTQVRHGYQQVPARRKNPVHLSKERVKRTKVVEHPQRDDEVERGVRVREWLGLDVYLGGVNPLLSRLFEDPRVQIYAIKLLCTNGFSNEPSEPSISTADIEKAAWLAGHEGLEGSFEVRQAGGRGAPLTIARCYPLALSHPVRIEHLDMSKLIVAIRVQTETAEPERLRASRDVSTTWLPRSS